jgi:hypothetical protein
MSLRTDYTGSLNSKLAQARAAGRDFVIVDNLATLVSELQLAAGQGKRSFSVSLVVSYQPSDLRAKGPLWSAYSSGLLEGLHSEDIMSNEASVSLDDSDSLTTRIKFNFSF